MKLTKEQLKHSIDKYGDSSKLVNRLGITEEEVTETVEELMERYLLDKPIDKFVLKDNVLYGVNPEEEDFIYCYDLSD